MKRKYALTAGLITFMVVIGFMALIMAVMGSGRHRFFTVVGGRCIYG